MYQLTNPGKGTPKRSSRPRTNPDAVAPAPTPVMTRDERDLRRDIARAVKLARNAKSMYGMPNFVPASVLEELLAGRRLSDIHDDNTSGVW